MNTYYVSFSVILNGGIASVGSLDWVAPALTKSGIVTIVSCIKEAFLRDRGQPNLIPSVQIHSITLLEGGVMD